MSHRYGRNPSGRLPQSQPPLSRKETVIHRPSSNEGWNMDKKQFIMGVANRISKSFGRGLSDLEGQKLLVLVNDLTYTERSMKECDLTDLVYKRFLTNIQPQKKVLYDPKGYFMDELARPDVASPFVYRSSTTGYGISHINVSDPDLTELHLKLKDTHLLLDTRFANIASSGNYTWSTTVSASTSISIGSVSLLRPVNRIVALELEPFDIPYYPGFRGFYDKYTLLVEEFNTQSIIRSDGRRFHFLLTAEYLEDRIRLTPANRRDYYFYNPINTLDNITIALNDMDNRVAFNPARDVATVTPGNPTIWTTSNNHNLGTGDLVYFTGFNSSSAFDDQINDPAGHFITKLSDTTFSIPLSTIGLGAASIVSSANVAYGNQRIFIPLTLRNIDTEST